MNPDRCEVWTRTRCEEPAVEVAVYLNPNINNGSLALCAFHLVEEYSTKFDPIGDKRP